uniref:MAT1-1-2 n=1 Tax=Cordyceps militaris TaxID=73501 RepID=Q5TLA3_CORMI|nr:MAT1-1-2 [Cordyceps militaris]
MDSIFSFSPFWTEDECIADSESAIDSIRCHALRVSLEKNRGREEKLPCLQGTRSLVDDNIIINRIVALGVEETIDPVLLVKEAIAHWYISAVPISTRDPHHGLPPDAEIEQEDGATILRWNRQYAAEKHEIANLGLIAMLLTSETWSRPESPTLRFGTLVANAATAILFGAFMIIPKVSIRESSNLLVSVLKDNEAMRLYLRTTWQLAQDGASKYTHSPSAEFGTTTSEVKIDHAGKRLLSKVGQENWSVASLWHPSRKTPGSAWNKFMRNTQQPYFPRKKIKTEIRYRLPSSCLSLAEPWEIYYSELRSKFDQVRCLPPPYLSD